MRESLRRWGVVLATLVVAGPLFAGEELLERELARLAEVSGGTMGVAAVHLESGRAAYLNADVAFPMASTQIEGIRVDRSTLELISDWIGVDELPPLDELDPKAYQELRETVPEEVREAAAEAFDEDPRDSATPRAMAVLLEKIWKGSVLSEASTELLVDIMERCETGTARLKGLLPEDTPVSHKTGTIGGTTNDVGVITLPHGAGHVIVAAFVKESELPVPDRERAIAEVARAAHDYFLFMSRN